MTSQGKRGVVSFRLVTLVVLAAAVVLAGCTTSSGPVTLPIGEVSVDGDRVGIQDSCHAGARLAVDEGPDVIELTFTVDAVTGGDCFSCQIATLRAPVGDREIIDSSTGAPLPQTGDCFTVY
jgi:hypothetical protein